MSTVLTLEQFNAHLKIIAERYDLGEISVTFNPGKQYSVANLHLLHRDGNEPDDPEMPGFYAEIRKLGCQTILTDNLSDWVHPYLRECDYLEFSETAFRNLEHLSIKHPELKNIKQTYWIPTKNEWCSSPNVEVTGKTHDELVIELGKKDPWLTFNQAKYITCRLMELNIDSFKYVFMPEEK